MLKAYSKLMDVLEKVLQVLIVILTVGMLFCMAYQVVMRYVFHQGNAWSEELARLLCIWIVMLGAALACRKYSHLQIDVFINLLHERARYLANAILMIVCVAFIVYMLKYSIDLCNGTGAATSAGLGISKKVVYLCMPVGCGMMILTSIEVIWQNIVNFIRFDANKEANK